MTYLPDVNVLIALVWPQHIHHEAAHQWFSGLGEGKWATCSLTQTAFVRISSNPGIITEAIKPGEALQLLRELVRHPAHEYWDHSPQFAAAESLPAELLQGYKQITDTYLLLRAEAKGGIFTTFDGRFARTVRETKFADSILLLS